MQDLTLCFNRGQNQSFMFLLPTRRRGLISVMNCLSFRQFPKKRTNPLLHSYVRQQAGARR